MKTAPSSARRAAVLAIVGGLLLWMSPVFAQQPMDSNMLQRYGSSSAVGEYEGALIHHLPVLEALFGTEPISLAQCTAWIVLGAIPLIVLESAKVVRQSSTPPLHTRTGYSVS